MSQETILREYARPPSARLFMARAFLPKRKAAALPKLELRLPEARLVDADLADYLRLTGLAADHGLPLSWPQVWGFRLQMALLTDRQFPLPIWSALQVRNVLRQHLPLPRDARYAIGVTPLALRRLEKGIEIDLGTRLERSGELAWESVTTFYWRGRGSKHPEAPAPDASSPEVGGSTIASWQSGAGEGWRFGELTGDFNGIHWNDRYARVFGFARAFHHPPRVAGQCLAHLGVEAHAPGAELRLWLKGPVFYRSALRLARRVEPGASVFGLFVGGETRPAIVGRVNLPLS